VSDNGLIIFIRNPEIGKVKTRLAKEVGPEKALRIYISLLNYTKEVSLKVNADRYLFYYRNIAEDSWPEEKFQKRVQEGHDLGENMKMAFQEVLHHHEKAVIIGSDCPQISAPLIESALDHLKYYDVVIGPSLDGGYYLLGMKKCYEYLFCNIPWSTSTVLEKTIELIKENNLSLHLLKKLSDIDHKEDWDKYGWTLSDN